MAEKAQPGDRLLVTRWVGLYGTSLLAGARAQTLRKRLPAWLIETAKQFDRFRDVQEETQIALSAGAHAVCAAGEGGVFGAMWQFAEEAGLGLDADFRQLPIRQETVEICNLLDVDPYLLTADGALLIAAPNGQAVCAALARADIPAVDVGVFTKGNDRVVRYKERCRYLEPRRFCNASPAEARRGKYNRGTRNEQGGRHE